MPSNLLMKLGLIVLIELLIVVVYHEKCSDPVENKSETLEYVARNRKSIDLLQQSRPRSVVSSSSVRLKSLSNYASNNQIKHSHDVEEMSVNVKKVNFEQHGSTTSSRFTQKATQKRPSPAQKVLQKKLTTKSSAPEMVQTKLSLPSSLTQNATPKNPSPIFTQETAQTHKPAASNSRSGETTRELLEGFLKSRKYKESNFSINMVNSLMDFVNVDYTNNIMITVKTTHYYYSTRLPLLLLTWMQTVDRETLFIISDSSNSTLKTVETIRKSGFNLISTKCKDTHSLSGLCCKTSEEFSTFYREVEKDKNRFKWFCHFDDDVYVNIKALSDVLDQFDPDQPYYIGRDRYHKIHAVRKVMCDNFLEWNAPCSRYWFQYSVGSGYCLSYAMMMKIARLLNHTKLFCDLTMFGDDLAVGTVVGSMFGYNLTDVERFRSQYDDYSKITNEELLKSVTISYNRRTNGATDSQINIPPQFYNDPTRFTAYHCLLHPSVPWCLKAGLKSSS